MSQREALTAIAHQANDARDAAHNELNQPGLSEKARAQASGAVDGYGIVELAVSAALDGTRGSMDERVLDMLHALDRVIEGVKKSMRDNPPHYDALLTAAQWGRWQIQQCRQDRTQK